MKRLMGRTDVENALQRLDSLTKEESLFIMARNLNVTHHVERVIRDVRNDLKVTRKLTEDIDDNIEVISHKVSAIEGSVDDDVKATKRTQVCYSLTVPSLTVKADPRS